MRHSWIRVAVSIAAGTAILAACGSSESSTSSSTSSTSQATTTTVASSTTSPAPDGQLESAVWPFVSGSTRFHDPVEAARSFAVDYLGFVAPVVGEFRSGDSRSGEVAIRPAADGPTTTVLVRQLTADDTWWVLGAATPSLQLTSPAALAAISSPVTLAGESTAFEATVNVEVRQDGTVDPLGQDFVMGGSMGEMGPFSKAVSFNVPAAQAGAIVLETRSAMDGTVWEAAVVRVGFA